MSKFLQKISELIKLETQIVQDSFLNTTNKGSGFEVIVRNFLSRYTNASAQTMHGEILDTGGNQTGQIDFCQVQNMHPLGYADGRPNIIFYDYLLTLGEVKMKLNTQELDKSIQTAEQLRQFRRHSDNNNVCSNGFYGSDSDEQKPPPFFIVALNSDIAYSTIEDRIANTLITMVSILNTQNGTGLICLGNTHRSPDLIQWLKNVATAISEKTFQFDNPIVPLIWAANEFAVPMINLTNLTPYYFK